MLWVELFFVPKWIFLIKKFWIGMNRQKNNKKNCFLVSLNEAPSPGQHTSAHPGYDKSRFLCGWNCGNSTLYDHLLHCTIHFHIILSYQYNHCEVTTQQLHWYWTWCAASTTQQQCGYLGAMVILSRRISCNNYNIKSRVISLSPLLLLSILRFIEYCWGTRINPYSRV